MCYETGRLAIAISLIGQLRLSAASHPSAGVGDGHTFVRDTTYTSGLQPLAAKRLHDQRQSAAELGEKLQPSAADKPHGSKA